MPPWLGAQLAMPDVVHVRVHSTLLRSCRQLLLSAKDSSTLHELATTPPARPKFVLQVRFSPRVPGPALSLKEF